MGQHMISGKSVAARYDFVSRLYNIRERIVAEDYSIDIASHLHTPNQFAYIISQKAEARFRRAGRR
jgi:hypothetical protein